MIAVILKLLLSILLTILAATVLILLAYWILTLLTVVTSLLGFTKLSTYISIKTVKFTSVLERTYKSIRYRK